MIKMHCRTPGTDCKNKSLHLVITGCFNQHIIELPLCQYHYDQFTIRKAQRTILCGTCGGTYEEFDVTAMASVSDWWKQEAIFDALRTIQQ